MTGNDRGAFRRVGRGGAGNVYPAKHDQAAAAATTAADRDLERQDAVAATVQDPAAAGQAIRAGRGGAGNYVDTSPLPGADDAGRSMSRQVAAAVASSRRRQPRRAMGGRGGAGNWTGEEHERRRRRLRGDDDDDDAAEELERKVREAVDKGLKVPEKVHHGREREAR
ncbi:uncharacterized protein MAM_02449 [Metarhizium album ARSEF 1941]|uniref:Uncharacterized protein n=1 Tax=Metarhizium album (strain ARSEF 1941) TaxID=1081103 RepID=A0A0B2WU48_METAS|nr:uncharacterized protein MAM_02449 [Metarhizium album ARSEF 1941]KHN99596.1 hypothetical protein MAM_02449 [Metarhizium album ARSEF 1941]